MAVTETTTRGEPVLRHEAGTSLIEMLMALLLFSIVILGILPVMQHAAQQDRGARNTSIASATAAQVMETLKYYRALQLHGITIPGDIDLTLNDPDNPDDHHTIDGTGTWASLGLDPTQVQMTYRLETDPLTGNMVALVGATTIDAAALNVAGGEKKWVEYTSAIE